MSPRRTAATHDVAEGRTGPRPLAAARLFLCTVAWLFTASVALGGQTHPFQSEFTGADTPDESLGSPADKLGVRQSSGNVYVIDRSHGVVDVFDGAGTYLSQLTGFGFSSTDPDLAIDNSSTASAGNVYVLPEFGPLSAFDASGTPLFQLSSTPAGPFGDVCGTAVDTNGVLYVADYSNQRIDKFEPSGDFIESLPVTFNPCDVAVDTDGTIYAIHWNNALHKLAPDGTDLGIIDDQVPKAVSVDLTTHHVFVVRESVAVEYDADGNVVSTFGDDRLVNARGVDVHSTSGKVYITSNPGAGSRVLIFGPLVPVPDAVTGAATSVTGTTATLNGHVDPAGSGDVTECHFEYGTDTTYGSSVPCAQALPITSPTDVSADVSGLSQSTVYHFKLVVGAENGTVSGGDQTFQTTGPPIVQAQPATNIATDGATLNAAIDPSGFQTTCVFEYVDDAAFQSSGFDTATTAPCVPSNVGSAGGAFVPVSADVSGLTSTTVYHFRAVATNAAGTTNGDDLSFQTAGVPVIVRESATDVTDATATLNATIVPSGFDTSCQFQFVSDAAFQSNGYDTATSVDCSPFDLGAGFDEQSTSASATGLTPGTLYHFRVVAMNSAGTTTGDDTTFLTLVSFLREVAQFGTAGTLAGQFQSPLGVAVDQNSGSVYVADSGNARIQKFDKKGVFKATFGWGVIDGQAEAQVCKSKGKCQAGIVGAGSGQFALPTSVAVDSSKSPAKGTVYVGDLGNNVVQTFNPNGKWLSTIDGAVSPQGHFVAVIGVAVDQNGNLWVADAGTGNVLEFGSSGSFLQQWSPGISPQAITVDAANDAVYLIGNGATHRFTLAGTDDTTIDPGSGTALAVDPKTGNLYVDHGDDVVVYDATGARIDGLFSLGGTTSSMGLAYYSTGKGKSLGKNDRLFVSDSANNLVRIYGPPAGGAPFISSESTKGAGATSKILQATIVPLGHKTTCVFEYVTATEFGMNGYANATTVPCTPSDLGQSFSQQQASATITGLTIGTFYHFRAVAMNSKGTTTGDDQTFQAGPGGWTPFSRCPVDDPAMLATDGVAKSSLCIASNSTHGSIKIGALPPTITGNSNLQGGLVADLNAAIFTFVAVPTGSLIADPAIVNAGGVTVLATVESAGAPSDFDLLAGLSEGLPILTLPIKIRLESQTAGVDFGPNCTIGTDQNPIVLHPANTDLTNVQLESVTFDADGTINPNGAFQSLTTLGAVQGDDDFAVPAVSGCGPNGDGTLDSLINTVAGLPSAAGNNEVVLDDASSALSFPAQNQTGAEVAAAWHSAFD